MATEINEMCPKVGTSPSIPQNQYRPKKPLVTINNEDEYIHWAGLARKARLARAREDGDA